MRRVWLNANLNTSDSSNSMWFRSTMVCSAVIYELVSMRQSVCTGKGAVNASCVCSFGASCVIHAACVPFISAARKEFHPCILVELNQPRFHLSPVLWKRHFSPFTEISQTHSIIPCHSSSFFICILESTTCISYNLQWSPTHFLLPPLLWMHHMPPFWSVEWRPPDITLKLSTIQIHQLTTTHYFGVVHLSDSSTDHLHPLLWGCQPRPLSLDILWRNPSAEFCRVRHSLR